MEQVQTVFANKPDLMAGCHWFIDWYGVADNPNVVAKEITCPALISSAGCRSAGADQRRQRGIPRSVDNPCCPLAVDVEHRAAALIVTT